MEDPYLHVVDHEEIVEQEYTFEPIAQKLSSFKRTVKKAKLHKEESTDMNNQQHGNVISENNIGSLQNILAKDPSLDGVSESLLKDSVAEGTFKSYSAPIRDFKEFCLKLEYELDLSTESVTHFLLSLAKSETCFSYVCKIKPALKFLADSMDKELIFSDHMTRLLTGLKRRAAKNRLPAKKAPILPLDTLKFLVKQEIIPFKDNPHMINKVVFRTLFRTMIEYFLHCRFNCFSKLEAQHFLCYEEEISQAEKTTNSIIPRHQILSRTERISVRT